MELIGDAESDKSNGSKRVTYRCDCGFIGTTRASRFDSKKLCQSCTRSKSNLLVNEYMIKGDIVYIDVSTNKFPSKFCRIDKKNIEKVIDGRGRWYAANFCNAVIYAVRGARGEKMHRLILNVSENIMIDHDDGDGLNNCESNLNCGTQSMNMRNISLSRRNKSGITGISQSMSGKWIARGAINRRSVHLGTYASIEDAVIARKKFEKDNYYNENHGRLRK